MRRVRRRRHGTPVNLAALVTLVVGAVALSLVAVPVRAVGETVTGSTTLTVFLKAPDPAALDRLAGTTGLTRAQRVSAVSRLVPGQAVRDAIERALRVDGFAVIGETSWSISATGPAARAATLFGTRPRLGTRPDTARRVAAAGALPRVPPELSSVVAAVYPTTGGPPAYRHASTGSLDGHDLRNADTPARVTPSTGQRDSGATVATLQLADFFGLPGDRHKSEKAADLSAYANEHGLTDPVTSGRYRAVQVDGGPSRSDDASGGDIEVNLDQQSILSTAPSAKQQAYFAPDTQAGFTDVFAHVYDDVVANARATAPDPHIVALSSSWGQCERLTGAASIATIEPILKSLVAAGVTVFAPSGDDGAYDCGSADGSGLDNTQADVDYPGSSPSVVSVGGSRLSAATSAPNVGTNWSETAWSCGTPVACQSRGGTGGSGGGASGSASASSDFGGFAAPAYQRLGIDDAPFRGSVKRLVPDITADGDPRTGFTVYTSNPAQMIGANHDVVIGGTSLAAPISAAQLTNALADAGHTIGVGDIHGVLYSAYARTRSLPATSPLRAFRDVTSGRIGADQDRGHNPSVIAQRGYDTVSGLGGVLWSALVPYLFDTHRPTATATLTQPRLRTAAWRQVVAAWRVSRGADPNLLGATDVRVVARGATPPAYAARTLPASGSHSIIATPGATYVLTATGYDLAHHRSAPSTATVQVPIDDSWFSISPGWRRVAGTSDIGGSHLIATALGAHATASRDGRSYRLLFHTGPASGRLGVYLGGRLITVVDLHGRIFGRASKVIFTSNVHAVRTFTFKRMDVKPVNVDGLYVSY